GTDFQVWWDNVKFKKFEGEAERETKVAGYVPSVQISGIPMPIREGSTMTLTSSNCDQLDSGETLTLYFSGDGVVESGNATYNISVRSGKSIHYLGKEYMIPGSKPNLLLPTIVDGRGRTMHANETWELGDGYNFSIRDICGEDSVLLELNRSNESLCSDVTVVDGVFEYQTDVTGVGDDVCLFRCTVEDILLDRSVQIDDLYLYSDTPVHVRVGDRYGEFEIDEICPDKIVFRNVASIIFGGTCSILNDTIIFEVSDNRRYAYLYTTETRSGTHKLTGTPSSYAAGAWMNLTGDNHPAFCYDFETKKSYEELNVYLSDDLFITAGNATYTATVIDDRTGFLGAMRRSFNPDRADLLGKILVNESEEVQLEIGESYVLDEGYLLTLRDIFVTGGTAWLELVKEGEVVESGACIEGGTFEYELYVTGRNVPIFECTTVTIFQDSKSGFILLKDIRQCSDDVEKLNVGKRYGKFKVSDITVDRIVLTNTESITINDETSILGGWLKFDVSGNSVTPYVEKEIGGRI
ncbi:MAG: S-layer protein domain-containing protein, partial [Euryarchaeota archaeon]|nr:S-layer protein domain-containing protein [Euryarchaeota archaeon]